MHERQMASVKLRRLDEIEDYLDGYGETHKGPEGKAYYLKIDHCQILPANEQGEHLILTIYHTVYLEEGA